MAYRAETQLSCEREIRWVNGCITLPTITHMDGQTRQRDPGGCVDEIPRQMGTFCLGVWWLVISRGWLRVKIVIIIIRVELRERGSRSM
jgi:hypothetical protein